MEPFSEMGTAYQEFLQEFIDAGEEGLLHKLPEEIVDPVNCIRRLKNQAKGLDLPEGWVPSTAYWLLSEKDYLLGEIHIRHRLTESLADFGGHIGYMVRPSERRKGYATRMLAMALAKAVEMGMARVLVTCDPGNTASARVIEKNGGRLFNESVARGGRHTSRYWISLR